MSLRESHLNEPEDWEVVVIGAGAAGLMAATEAALAGRRTLLLEKNRKAGVKILMSGGTRCNITQATDNRGIVAAFGPQGRFLHSALAAFGVQDTIEMFHAEGVPTKIEQAHAGFNLRGPLKPSGGKVFPASDKATDVLAALLRRMRRSGLSLALDEGVVEIDRQGDHFQVRTARRAIHAQKLILTTGGQSYPGCGTTGDGYRWAAQFGHSIVTPRPALVPITSTAHWVRELAGITIPDVALCVLEPSSTKPRVLAERRGSLLFAHFGLSGPVALDVSRTISGHSQPLSLTLECDFLPSVSAEAWLATWRDASRVAGKKQLVNLIESHLPQRLCEALLTASDIEPTQKAAEVSTRTWGEVVAAFKRQPIPVSGTLGFKKAEVTAGGIALAEVDSRSMESKLVPNLFLAGEVLDLDGPIGGYNFQAAWSTGALAGRMC